MLTRRTVLSGLSASVGLTATGWAAAGNPVAVAAAQTPQGQFALIGLDHAGGETFRIPLPARGHAAAAHPHLAEVVAFARRPGTFAFVVDCATGTVRQKLEAPAGRHFYGHGAFSLDGTTLFTTENDYATGAGRIGVWARASNFVRVGEFASGGIGPHEIVRCPTGDLAVANGGIQTHPDTGREKLNLDSMRPNLSILSPDGILRDQAEVPWKNRQNSLRHIAVFSDGAVGCGFQWQGDPYDAPPLVGLYQGGGMLRPLELSDAAKHRMVGYVGSIGALGQSTIVATAPRGGLVCSFDFATGEQGTDQAIDVCGVSSGVQSLVTDGTGRVYTFDGKSLTLKRTHDLAFDNHAVTVQPNT